MVGDINGIMQDILNGLSLMGIHPYAALCKEWKDEIV